MAVEHTFPPENWEFICAELAEQKQMSPLWAAPVTSSNSLPALGALRALYNTSKLLRCITHPLLRQSSGISHEIDGFGRLCQDIISKPQLASLVNGLEVAPSPRFAVDGGILVEVSRRLGFNPDHFSIPAAQRKPTPNQRFADLALLANLLPCFLPNLKCLKMRLGLPPDTRQVLRYFRCGSIVKPFESVTTLVLDAQTDGLQSTNGCVLEDYSQLLASLPNLQLLSLWRFKRVLATGNGNLLDISGALPTEIVESVGKWLPKGLRSLHMQDCALEDWATIALLSNCRVLETLFYAPRGRDVLALLLWLGVCVLPDRQDIVQVGEG
ncbi:hypothetical protein PG984_006775 [Apiospora sp. TS-2023a]